MALLIYGVTRGEGGDGRSSLPAPDPNGQVRLVRSRELAALLCEIADDAVLGDNDAAAYIDALIGMLDPGPILPVRFGTVASDEDAVRREFLDVDPGALTRSLDALQGMVEVRLEVDADVDADVRRVAETWPELQLVARTGAVPHSLHGRLELGREICVRVAEFRDALCERLFRRLDRFAVAHAVLESHCATLLRQAYLLRSEGLPAFDDAVRAVYEELGHDYRIHYTGPLPAFDFVDLQLGSFPNGTSAKSRWGF